ncbi:MAG: lysophospholipid transporter LplT [Gammaproteobacteria bacterium]
MPRDVWILLLAQFLTAFADNALLFAAIEMIGGAQADKSYVAALQASFVVAYVVLAAWVGPFADLKPKGRVLTWANAVKALGAALLLAGLEPLIAYCLVGVGAVMYSPAKYGILPELVDGERLMRANAWVEGATIAAIILGMLAGAALAEYSVTVALAAIMGLFILSGALALFIRPLPPVITVPPPASRWLRAALADFMAAARDVLAQPRGRFTLLGSALFWSSAALLRLMVIAWAPVVLAVTTTTGIAELTLWTALGIAVGAFIAPRVIGLDSVRRARFAAWAMGLAIILLGLSDDVGFARVALFAAGVAGGLFVVPVNAVLQDIGHRGSGSGAVVGVQRFAENLAMLLATAVYALAVHLGLPPVVALLGLGGLVFLATWWVSRQLPTR